MALVVFFSLMTLKASSGVPASDQKGDPSLLIVPSFERPSISRYLPLSKRTLLAPAFVTKSGEITFVRGREFQTSEQWDRFVKAARERQALQLATIDPQMIRDNHGVIQMAVIVSENPTTASCIMQPGFLQYFSAIFGPELLIAIPTRNKICIFPKLANHLPLMRDAIRDDYLISPMPASTEIFELSKNGLRAVGSLNPDDE